MKTLILIAIVIVVAYSVVNFAPADFKSRIGSTLGVGKIVQSTGDFLRSKLSMPGDPVAKRKAMVDQLSTSMNDAKAALRAAVPVSENGRIPPQPSATEMKADIERAQNALAASSGIIDQLKIGAGDTGAVSTAAVRLVDYLVPPSPSSTTPVCVPTPK